MKLTKTMLGLGIAAGYLLSKSTPASAASSTVTLRPGTYRVRFPTAALDASVSLSSLFALPQVFLQGLGGVATFEALLTKGADWQVTALMQYAGPVKSVTLSPGTSVERL